MVLNDQECLLPARPISVMRLLLPDPNYQVAESECYTKSRCSRPMCGVAAGLSRPSEHLIRLAFTMRSTPHNVGHHESRFPSLGITENISAEARAEAPPSTSRITRSRKSFERAFVMASLRESDAEDSLNSALLGILLRRIRFSPNEKCSKSRGGGIIGIPRAGHCLYGSVIDPTDKKQSTACRGKFVCSERRQRQLCGPGGMLA